MKIDGNIDDKFTVSLDRTKDDYLIILFNKEDGKLEHYDGKNIENIISMLVQFANKGDFQIKFILKELILKYINDLVISSIELDKLKN